MYSATLAKVLHEAGIDTVTVADLRLTGAPDVAVFAAAQPDGRAVLTENVADVARLAADHVSSGSHHAGLLIALSSRFSRRPAGVQPLAAAVRAVADEPLHDRVVYLQAPGDRPA